MTVITDPIDYKPVINSLIDGKKGLIFIPSLELVLPRYQVSRHQVLVWKFMNTPHKYEQRTGSYRTNDYFELPQFHKGTNGFIAGLLAKGFAAHLPVDRPLHHTVSSVSCSLDCKIMHALAHALMSVTYMHPTIFCITWRNAEIKFMV